MTPLAGKRAIVTGGGSGIGRAIAEALADAGAGVTVCGRGLDKCATVARGIADRGGQAEAVACNIADAAELAAVFDTDRPFDIAVCNAGIAGAAQPFQAMDLGDWSRTLAVNLTGTMLTAQAAARGMIAAGRGGAIITVASIGAWKCLPASADYCASKAAVLQLTRCMALDLARHGIRANAICPGFVRTDLAPDLIEQAATRAARTIPLGRIGVPADLADLAVWLASDASGYVTGTHFTVDGGLTLM